MQTVQIPKLIVRIRFPSPRSTSLRCPRELRQHVHASSGPFAPEAPHFLETENRVKMKRGEVIRPSHVEHFVGTVERPAQAGPRQLSGDTAAPPRRIHQNATEVAASRSTRTRLIGCQLEDPAVGDYLALALATNIWRRSSVMSDANCSARSPGFT